MRIPIVNEQDEIIKVIDINDRKPSDISRNTSVWLLNEKNELLLAQRAFRKRREAGLWGPSTAGFVEEGETYESNAVKEAEEEIGLKNVKLVKGKKFRRSTDHEYFGQTFIARVDSNYPFVIDKFEVENIKWVFKEELQKLLEEKPKD